MAEASSRERLTALRSSFSERALKSQVQTTPLPVHGAFSAGDGRLRVSSAAEKGCRVCKGSGWIEILGCGMVHPSCAESG